MNIFECNGFGMVLSCCMLCEEKCLLIKHMVSNVIILIVRMFCMSGIWGFSIYIVLVIFACFSHYNTAFG